MKKIAVVLGTRPEIIKLSPVIPLLDKHFKLFIIHTGQHYSYNMDKLFFEELKLRNADYQCNVGSGSQACQTGMMMIEIEKIILKEAPDLILVQGDTNTTLAGALVAAKNKIPLAHIEAGYRSHNLHMPEEINRIIADRFSRYLFVGIPEGMKNLRKEGITASKKTAKLFLVGNTALDALRRNEKFAEDKIISRLRLQKNDYVLATVHRAENTDEAENLKNIAEALNKLAEKITIIFPAHPRTKLSLEKHELTIGSSIRIIEPAGYLEFISLMKNARFIMTDSGGIQEESAELNIPCLILRNETEAVHLVNAGKTILAGNKSAKIAAEAEKLLNDSEIKKIKERPFLGEYGVAEKIVAILSQELAS